MLIIPISGCSDKRDKILSFEDSIGFYSSEKQVFYEPNSTISIEGKYIIDTLVLKIVVFDKEDQGDKFKVRHDIIKGKKYFGNFRDKDGFDLFDFPITIQTIPTYRSGPGVSHLYHDEQKRIKITPEKYELIDSFSLSVNNDLSQYDLQKILQKIEENYSVTTVE